MYISPDYRFIPRFLAPYWQYHKVVKSLQSGAGLLGSIYDSTSTICVDLAKLLKLFVFQFTCLKIGILIRVFTS